MNLPTALKRQPKSGIIKADFDIPEAWEMLTRGIKWASESKYAPKEEWLKPVYPGKNSKFK